MKKCFVILLLLAAPAWADPLLVNVPPLPSSHNQSYLILADAEFTTQSIPRPSLGMQQSDLFDVGNGQFGIPISFAASASPMSASVNNVFKVRVPAKVFRSVVGWTRIGVMTSLSSFRAWAFECKQDKMMDKVATVAYVNSAMPILTQVLFEFSPTKRRLNILSATECPVFANGNKPQTTPNASIVTSDNSLKARNSFVDDARINYSHDVPFRTKGCDMVRVGG